MLGPSTYLQVALKITVIAASTVAAERLKKTISGLPRRRQAISNGPSALEVIIRPDAFQLWVGTLHRREMHTGHAEGGDLILRAKSGAEGR
jgi:hypothetical protein